MRTQYFQKIACAFCTQEQKAPDGTVTQAPTEYWWVLAFRGQCPRCGSVPERPEVVEVRALTPNQQQYWLDRQYQLHLINLGRKMALERLFAELAQEK